MNAVRADQTQQSKQRGPKERPLSCGSDSGYSGSLGSSNPDKISSADHSCDSPMISASPTNLVEAHMGFDARPGRCFNTHNNNAPLVVINGDIAQCPGDDPGDPPSGESDISEGHREIESSRGEEEITLPKRFQLVMSRLKPTETGKCCGYHSQSKAGDTSPVDHLAGPGSIDSSCNDVTYEEREKDISIVLSWLRQEMSRMKEQDRTLMRSFLELRSSIHGFRNTSQGPHSATDLTSTSTNNLTVPGTSKGYSPQRSPLGLKGDECQVEFRARTVSMVPPRPKKVLEKLQIKAISKELL